LPGRAPRPDDPAVPKPFLTDTLFAFALLSAPVRGVVPAERLEATFDALLAAVRTGDDARLSALVEPGATMVEGHNRVAGPGPLTADRLRRFALECSRIAGATYFATDPPTHVAPYRCNGHDSGFELHGEFSADGARIAALRMFGPGPTAAEWAQIEAARAASDAIAPVVTAQINETLDALFEAARRGDETAFAARTVAYRNRITKFVDYRSGRWRERPFTASSLRRIAQSCRRTQQPYRIVERGLIARGAYYVCGGEPGYAIFGSFADGGRLAESLWMHGPNSSRDRRPAAERRREEAEDAARRVRSEALRTTLSVQLDALLDAARNREGDRFQALVATDQWGRTPHFVDRRTSAYHAGEVPLTAAALRPFVLVCRPENDRRPIVEASPYRLSMPLICGSEPDYYLTAWFTGGDHRISRIEFENRNRPRPVH
jgi:hypothetical protein